MMWTYLGRHGVDLSLVDGLDDGLGKVVSLREEVVLRDISSLITRIDGRGTKGGQRSEKEGIGEDELATSRSAPGFLRPFLDPRLDGHTQRDGQTKDQYERRTLSKATIPFPSDLVAIWNQNRHLWGELARRQGSSKQIGERRD